MKSGNNYFYILFIIPLVSFSMMLYIYLQIPKINMNMQELKKIQEPIEEIPTEVYNPYSPTNLGITIQNFPVLDGATATQPIRQLIACKFYKIECHWAPNENKEMFMYFSYGNMNHSVSLDDQLYLEQRLLNSKTHEAYLNLINKKVDLVIMATTPSIDETAEAKKNNVELEITPIALDGFIFVVNSENPVKNLSSEQLKQIYTKKIVNWKSVGGDDALIIPYVRVRNSGSQELMEKIFMKGTQIADFPEERRIEAMFELLKGVEYEKDSIGYSLYYYKNSMIDKNTEEYYPVKVLSVDGITPTPETISLKEYPYVFNIYAVSRKDLDPKSPAYIIKQWLNTPDGQALIKEAGYSPLIPESSKDSPMRLNEIYY